MARIRSTGQSPEHSSGPDAAVEVLVIGSDPGIIDALGRTPGAAGGPFRIERAVDFETAFRRSAAHAPDVILLDAPLAGRHADALRAIRAAAPSAALIVLVNSSDERAALEAVHAGAQDVLARDAVAPAVLGRSVRYAIERQRLLLELERRMRALEASQANLSNIIRTTADGIVIVDGAGIIRFANPAAERLLGRPAAEIVGEPFGHALATGETAEVDLARSPDGASTAELHVVATEWQGAPAQLVSLRDITERRRVEQQARELLREQVRRAEAEAAERRASFLGETSSALAGSLDYRRTLHDVAHFATAFFGGLCVIDFVNDDGSLTRIAAAGAAARDAPAVASIRAVRPTVVPDDAIADVLGTARTRLLDAVQPELLVRFLGSDPEAANERIHSALLVPLHSRGRTLGLMGLLSRGGRAWLAADVALADELGRRIAVAIDNARLFEEAQNANRAKADFLAVMSHELRTPLNAIIGYADLLTLGIQGEPGAGTVDYADRIRSSARHLLMLIEEILGYARTEAGREDLRIDDIELFEILDAVRDVAEPLAIEKGISLEILANDNVPLVTDGGKIRQILINLVSNAAKFTDQGSVRLEARALNGSIEFRVTDTGPGIRREHLERIFEPFWQAEQSRSRRASGTGLGLAVARRYARLLGGDITVASEPGHGARFLLVIPTRAPRPPADPHEVGPEPAQERASEQAPEPDP